MRRAKGFSDLLMALALATTWLAVALATRPLIPIDETRYVTVAWDMHTSGNYLVPHLNGEIYTHKPPLFFWLINAFWNCFGVSTWAARVVGPMCSLACVGLTYYVGRRLWPNDRQLAGSAALLLVSGTIWALFSSLTMFDTGLCFFVLLFAVGLLKLADGAEKTGIVLLGLALGGGLLQKGPAVFLHTVPVALLAPYWVDRTRSLHGRRWYASLAAALALGLLIVLAWAVPAILDGGREYGEAILWRQSAGRVVQSFAHKRPFWWYLPIIPALLFPWSMTWPAWRSLPSVWGESAVRLCILWITSSCVMFSMLSGKQIHYLLPVIPFGALLMARLLSTLDRRSVQLLVRSLVAFYLVLAAGMLAVPLLAHRISEIRPLVHMTPNWIFMTLLAALAVATTRPTAAADVIRRLTVSAVLLWTAINGMVLPCLRERIDLEPFARHVARYQQTNPDIAYLGKYHGQLNFLGRLQVPIHELSSPDQLSRWVLEHPQGLVILNRQTSQPLGPGLLAFGEEPSGRREQRLELWEARLAQLTPEHVNAEGVVDVPRHPRTAFHEPRETLGPIEHR